MSEGDILHPDSIPMDILHPDSMPIRRSVGVQKKYGVESSACGSLAVSYSTFIVEYTTPNLLALANKFSIDFVSMMFTCSSIFQFS